MRSLGEILAGLGAGARAAFLAELSPRERLALLYAWRVWARPEQLPPEDDTWSVLLVCAGRGYGKSRTGAEYVRARVDRREGRSIGLIGPTLQDIRDDMLGEGRDGVGEGLLNVWPPHQRPRWEASKRRVTFHTGAIATIFSAEEPELRGPNLDTVWCDELVKWRYLDSLWSNLELALRRPGPTPPRVIITTTPKPLGLLRELIADPTTRVIRGSTFDNASNLSPAFLARMQAKFAGTRLGRQELYAEILDDNPDGLFRQADIDRARVAAAPREFAAVVVAVDPAVSTGRSSDETGIVVLGRDRSDRLFVLEDVSGRYAPEAWASAVVAAADRWAPRSAGGVVVVAETNRGGDLVASVLRSKRSTLAIALVRAARGKELRAEPVASLYAQSRVSHVGRFVELEQQMVEWAGGGTSPDRLDALVWGAWHLAALADGVDPLAAFDGLEESTAALERAARPPQMGELHDYPEDDDFGGYYAGISPLTIG